MILVGFSYLFIFGSYVISKVVVVSFVNSDLIFETWCNNKTSM